jgi:hypothetical protein
VLAAAFVVRLGVAVLLPNIHQADEIYQVAEQATVSLHGYGIVSWEFQTAARPALLAALVWPIHRIAASPATHQALVAVLFSAISLIPVWVSFHWAGRLHGPRNGALAAVMMATWFELVYFGSKPTADMVCAAPLLLGTFLARPGASWLSLLGAGLSLALAAGLRMQVAPAVAIVLSLAVLVDWRERIRPMAGGFVLGIAVVGAIEWGWWGAPFRGHWGYLAVEYTSRVSSAFGREPVTFFAKNAVLMYGGALPVILLLVAAGARRAPILLIAAAALVLPFHLIPHKEYRFVIAAVPFMVLLMGIGTGGVVERVAGALPPRGYVLIAAMWLLGMVAMSLGDTFRPNWTRDRNAILAFREVGAQPDACGVGLLGIRWYHTPGYSGLGRDVPVYEGLHPGDVERLAPAANYILAATKAAPPPAPFVRWREYSRPQQYLYKRPGGCEPGGMEAIRRPPLPTVAR